MESVKFNDYMLHKVGFEKEKEMHEREQKLNDMIHTPRRKNIIPVQEEYKLKIDNKMNEINNILAPTATKITKLEVLDELREKLFVGIKPSIDKFNKCNYQAKDLHDNFSCSEELINNLNEKGVPLALKLAKEY